MDNSKHSSIWQIKTFFFIFWLRQARQPTKRFLRQLKPYFGASNKSKPTWPAFTQKRWDTFDKWFKVRQMVVLNYPMPNADSQNFKLDLQLYTSSRQIVTLFYLQNRWFNCQRLKVLWVKGNSYPSTVTSPFFSKSSHWVGVSKRLWWSKSFRKKFLLWCKSDAF